MDPFTLSLMAVGAATSIFGSISGAGVAKQSANISANIAQNEQLENNQRQQQMELQASRQQLENARNTQRARAQGVNAAVSDGAQYGSGLAGAQGAAQDQGLYNSLGINQNLGIGRTLFGLSNTISADKIQLAQLGGQAATDQGITNIGGDITKSASALGNMSKGTGFNPFGSTSSGNYQGLPWSQNTGGLY